MAAHLWVGAGVFSMLGRWRWLVGKNSTTNLNVVEVEARRRQLQRDGTITTTAAATLALATIRKAEDNSNVTAATMMAAVRGGNDDSCGDVGGSYGDGDGGGDSGLHHPKLAHHIRLQHFAAVDGVLFARAALVVCLSADNFGNNAGRMKYHGVRYFC